MSELNSTFPVEKPVFEWPKKTDGSPIRSQIRLKSHPSRIQTPCTARRVPVNADKAPGVVPQKLPCGPQRVPVTPSRNSVRHSISATPSAGNGNRTALVAASVGPRRVPVTPSRNSVMNSIAATLSDVNGNRTAVGIASVGPRRVPVTLESATPYQDPNRMRRTIYATPSMRNENRDFVSVTSARKDRPQPQRVPLSEAKQEKTMIKSKTDKLQKLLNYE